MIELSFSIWHVWALVYWLTCMAILLSVTLVITDDGGWTKWNVLKLGVAFVWPLLLPIGVYCILTYSVKELRGRLRAQGQFRDFQEWLKTREGQS